jgi:UDP-GlcNAc:undecaprenyl-phosphate GlcNAc-1-phosphate transferase
LNSDEGDMTLLEFLPNVVLAFFLTLLLVEFLNRPARRLGLVDQPDEHKRYKGSIPLIGGIAMCLAFTGAALLSFSLSSVQNLIGELPLSYYSLFLGMGLVAVVGAIDDVYGLTTRSRFIVQIIATVIMMAMGGVYLNSLGNLLGFGAIQLGYLALPFTIFCVVGVTNAINMADGMDGLAGGLGIIASGWLMILASMTGLNKIDVAILLLLIAVLGAFLCVNLRHPWRARADVFMGDAGSMALGFVLCWFLVKLSQGEQPAFSPITAVWIMGLPLMDTVGLMIRRKLQGRSPTQADRQHLHHLLLRMGFSDGKTTAILLLASTVMGGIGVSASLAGISDYLMFYIFLLLFAGYYFATGYVGNRRKQMATLAR